jgi:hypothetical protein
MYCSRWKSYTYAVESWNGSSWTEVADLNTARNNAGGSGNLQML